MSTFKTIGIGVLAALALLLAFTPFGHELIFGFLILNFPLIVVACILTAIVIGVSVNSGGTWTGAAIVSGILATIVFAACVILFPAITKNKLAGSIQPSVIQEQPDSQTVRFTPYEVAMTLAKGQFQDPRHRIDDLDPVESENGINWVGPGLPNGLFNSLVGKTSGVVTITPDEKFHLEDVSFSCAEGMWTTDNLKFRSYLKKYTSKVDEAYEVKIGGEWVLVAPYMTWKFTFPVMVPQWGGVFLIHPDCRIENLPREAAITDPRLDGLRLVPEDYVKKVADSWMYRDGIPNAWFTHRDQVEVPVIEDESNQLPYLIPTVVGEQWWVGFEPYGPSFSIYKMLYADAHTGVWSLYTPSEPIISPNKAAGYVQSALPNVQWRKNNNGTVSGSIVLIEPRPVFKDDVLYWMLSQTNATEFAGVNDTYFVRGDNRQVYKANSLAEIDGWLAGRNTLRLVQEDQQCTTNTSLTDMSSVELLDLIQQAAELLKSKEID